MTRTWYEEMDRDPRSPSNTADEPARCELCGETFREEDERAEVGPRSDPDGESLIVHAECYLAREKEYELA